jgi:hypothetical protein
VADHVSARLVLSVDSSFGSLDWKSVDVHDAEGSVDDLALHETHNLIRSSRTSVDHLRESERGVSLELTDDARRVWGGDGGI